MSFQSALYQGRVRHTRLRPVSHDFEYRVFYMLYDIDELDVLDRDLSSFSVGRRNLFSFDRSDHGSAEGISLRPWVEQILASAGVDLEGGAIRLLAHPRILGYVFNPLSVWYCYGPERDLRAVIHEVHNTFGDRHAYVVPILDDERRHDFDKEMHVSPYNDMDQAYAFAINDPRERALVSIEVRDSDGPLLRAGMRLSRLELTDANIVRLFLTHPLMTLKVVTAIHWEALKLWLKGATFHPRPDPSASSITVVGTRSAVR